MAEIINLRQQRKAKSRNDKAKSAEQNRAKHGRTKAETELTSAAITLHERHLSGHKLPGKDD